jgi:alpha-amylase
LINSLKRRPEAYHGALKNVASDEAKNDLADVQSIHGQRRSKEEGLERWLQYDRWSRNCFRLLLFGLNKTYQDCASIQLGEDAALAGGRYVAKNVSDRQLTLAASESRDWLAEKMLTFRSTEKGFDVECDLALRRKGPGTVSTNVGVEVVINFLAPSTNDRYFQSNGKRFPLRWAAAVPAADLSVVDEWQQIRARIEAPSAPHFWIAPIETVSESEEGFERIYQGSQVIAVWPIELAAGAEWKGRMVLRVEHLSKPM